MIKDSAWSLFQFLTNLGYTYKLQLPIHITTTGEKT